MMRLGQTIMTSTAATADLLVCVKCKRGAQDPVDDRRPGQRLFDTLSTRDMPPGVRLRAVECLQNCDHGCTVALRGGGKWSYIYGNVDETSHTDMLLDGAARYTATQDGLIPWRERPEHFKRNCIARLPPLEDTND
ncbi:DUF1636 domain-containing protein [uncultured Roseobacter sp.]|uniref:DUF1636 domain-containing protein n=1 Tax=uncultured Roseobacter sp. TaxID=114847 RepID=UPI00260A9521|nr:DUF1636 domain-containing protein [uncultured Roseobacter sp.]